MKKATTIKVELEFERIVHQSRSLSVFRRNPSTWELLLRLADEGDQGIDGVYNAIEGLETRYLGGSALLKFVRECRDEGLIEFREHTKRSAWRLTLEPSLRKELFATLAWRNAELLNGHHKPLANGSASSRPDHTLIDPRTDSDARD